MSLKEKKVLTFELNSPFVKAFLLFLVLTLIIKAINVYSKMDPKTKIRHRSRYQSIAFT